MLKILNKFNILQQAQRGAVLMVMLVILIVGGSALLLNSLSNTALRFERDKITADALIQAKEALIAYAVSVQISSANAANQPRPGDLPCPDTNDDGYAEASCGNATGSTQQANRLGRLPYKTLGLPDLRDSSNERLWYAISNSFKYNTRSTIPLNSDTPGTISVRNADGSIQFDASAGNGVAGIVIAPGAALQRNDQSAIQDRSIAGINNPINYLDIVTSIEDNAAFIDSTSNGFIHGIVKDNSGAIVLNDQMLVVTVENIMGGVQKRVAGEVKKCLDDYALSNNGRYPWAVPINSVPYNDDTSQLFGRIPDDFTDTVASTGGFATSTGQWGICTTHFSNNPSTWWQNWREMVFYGVASAYKPNNPPSAAPICSVITPCLTVNPPSAASDKKYIIIVAGKTLPSQLPRITNSLVTYLEGGNQLADQSGGFIFIQSAPSATFNDSVVYK